MIDQQSAPSTALSGPSGRTAAFFLVAAALVVMLALPVRNWFLQQARINDAQGRLEQVRQQLEELEADERRWSDPEVVEQEARLRLNYVRPGEVGIVVLQPSPGSGPATAAAPADTWLDSLWQSVDAAAGRGDAASREQFEIRPTAPR